MVRMAARFALGSLLLFFATPARSEENFKTGDSFKDCADCPEMVVVPAGSFTMGSKEGEPGHDGTEAPQHQVTIAKPFAVARFAVTFTEWDACLGGRRMRRL